MERRSLDGRTHQLSKNGRSSGSSFVWFIVRLVRRLSGSAFVWFGVRLVRRPVRPKIFFGAFGPEKNFNSFFWFGRSSDSAVPQVRPKNILGAIAPKIFLILFWYGRSSDSVVPQVRPFEDEKISSAKISPKPR